MSFEITCLLVGVILMSITALTLSLVSVRVTKQTCVQLENTILRQAERLEALQRQIDLSDSGVQGMGKRLMEFDKRLRKTLQRAESFEIRDPQAAAYSHAVKLVERGAGVEDIVKSCGLSRSEAELVKVLQSQLRPAQASA